MQLPSDSEIRVQGLRTQRVWVMRCQTWHFGNTVLEGVINQWRLYGTCRESLDSAVHKIIVPYCILREPI